MKPHNIISALFIFLLSFPACSGTGTANDEENKTEDYSGRKEKATFAGGCFWCIEAPFEDIEGILTVVSGYAGGKEKNPTYEAVSSGKTSHREAVQITYDPDIISYSELVDIFWQLFDPTDEGGSFYDRGQQYTSAIFYHNDTQRQIAEVSKMSLDQAGLFNKPVVTPIIKYSNFYRAEDYHQDYYKKKPREYKAYRTGSGRDKFIHQHWEVPSVDRYPKPSDTQLKAKLTALQYKVTKEEATERAFDNKYNDNKASGIYVCIVSGAPLFSSKDKYESGSGWPSFTKPIDARFLEKPVDRSQGMLRIEVRSKYGDSHLGHVFNDGPPPTGLRYCMNSAAMEFIPKAAMEKEGYARYLWLVD